MWTIAIPVIIYFLVATGLFANLLDLTPAIMFATVLKVAIVFVSVWLAEAGVDLAWCVLVAALAPGVSVVAAELGYFTPAANRDHR
jgi:hypothetical protein